MPLEGVLKYVLKLLLQFTQFFKTLYFSFGHGLNVSKNILVQTDLIFTLFLPLTATNRIILTCFFLCKLIAIKYKFKGLFDFYLPGYAPHQEVNYKLAATIFLAF